MYYLEQLIHKDAQINEQQIRKRLLIDCVNGITLSRVATFTITFDTIDPKKDFMPKSESYPSRKRGEKAQRIKSLSGDDYMLHSISIDVTE